MTLNAPPNTPMSSPISITRSSRAQLLAQRRVQRLAVAHLGHQRRRPRRPAARSVDLLRDLAVALGRAADPPSRRRLARRPPRRLGGLDRVRAAHLVVEHVHVVVQRLRRRERRGLGERDRRVHPRDRLARRSARARASSITPSRSSSSPNAGIGSRSRQLRDLLLACGTARGRPSSGRGSGR